LLFFWCLSGAQMRFSCFRFAPNEFDKMIWGLWGFSQDAAFCPHVPTVSPGTILCIQYAVNTFENMALILNTGMILFSLASQVERQEKERRKSRKACKLANKLLFIDFKMRFRPRNAFWSQQLYFSSIPVSSIPRTPLTTPVQRGPTPAPTPAPTPSPR